MMKQLLFTNWHLMRIVRLAFALLLFYNAYETHELFFIIFGIFFLAQVIFNIGCDPKGCAIPNEKIADYEK